MQSQMSTKPTDLIFTVDGTASMEDFLESLNASISQIFQILDVTNVIRRVSMIVYRDYCDKKIIDYCDWTTDRAKLTAFANANQAIGGGDAPEASKTAVNKILDVIDDNANTIVIWYTDAPAHHATNNIGGSNSNYARELLALKNLQKSSDWIDLCEKLKSRNVCVYPIVNNSRHQNISHYVWLATITGGTCIYLPTTTTDTITRLTIKLFLNLMGCENELDGGVKQLIYDDLTQIKLVTNENNAMGYLPSSNHKTVVFNSAKITNHEWLTTNLRQLLVLFNKDAIYKNKIYDLFVDLMKPDSVIRLTYNTIFAAFWRLICRDYDDSRRDTLKNKLSETLHYLKTHNRTTHQTLTDWINNSYNQTYEVNEIICKAPSSVPALVIDTNRTYIPQELLEINRSLNSQVLHLVSDMLSQLRVVENVDELPKTVCEVDVNGNPAPIKYIPLSLNNRQLFGIIPHLIAPGSNFSKRPSLIMAAVAYITSNAILKTRAAEYLQECIGKWIDFQIPENFAGGFINLMSKIPEFLTETEISEFQFYQSVFGLLINGSTNIDIKTPATPFKQILNDYKIMCSCCEQYRSFTLMTLNEYNKYVCGLCCYNDTYTEKYDSDRSCYLSCKWCLALYAVIRVEDMNVTPKCHGCRNNVVLPRVTCTQCCNAYVDPANVYTRGHTFVCAQCNANPNLSIADITVQFNEIYNQNIGVICNYLGFELPSDINIFGGHHIFALKDKIKCLQPLQPLDSKATQLFYNKKPILNFNKVLATMINWIKSGKSELGYCMICFNEFIKKNLRSVCGRKSCKSVACNDCLKSWYGENTPGNLIQVNALACAFCKQYPSFNVLSKYNAQVCTMVRDSTSRVFDSNWWYAWCTKCYKPCAVVEKICSVDAPIFNSKFCCENCNNVPENSKQCPNGKCGIAIIKNGGCNHMECTACNSHFCWLCVDTCYDTSDFVYAHLNNVHGGAFGGNYDSDDSDNDDGYGSN